ncbi:hypothetical protein [Phenylobacterium sp.]|uniref:hypothetical protein n=1 Tax=Phenylobacterium sp. TaxID=1871053 RepID=UPI0027317ADB|nr:hypothetical protein [Phenylobacterium sp.]MDP1875198.1 hypothetical protein [Phenylobacterium sp.]
MASDRPGGDARRQLALGWAVIMVVAGAIYLLNVLGFSRGGRESVGLHLIYEGSSWLAIALLAWAPFFILRWGQPRALVAAMAAHVLGAGLFAFGHVGLFILLRAAAFAILDDLAEAVAEFRYGRTDLGWSTAPP